MRHSGLRGLDLYGFVDRFLKLSVKSAPRPFTPLTFGNKRRQQAVRGTRAPPPQPPTASPLRLRVGGGVHRVHGSLRLRHLRVLTQQRLDRLITRAVLERGTQT